MSDAKTGGVQARLAEILADFTIEPPQTHGNMQVYPVRVKNGHQRNYQTLDEAMAAKTVEVMEVSEGGSVPTLTVRNRGTLPVLLVIGEELVGAKQNRVLNTSLLVPAERDLQIPVSCVEQGRWSYRGRQFTSSTTSSHMRLRKAQTENVTKSLRTGPLHYDANQSEVWNEVSRKMSSHASSSATHALHEVYEQTETQLKEYMDAFTPPEAEGMVVTIGGQVVGADVFDHAKTFQSLWPKLLRSYALDALEQSQKVGQATGGSSAPAADDVPLTVTKEFLALIRKAKDEVYDSVGLGKDVRLSSDDVAGSALVWDDQLIHASLFNSKV